LSVLQIFFVAIGSIALTGAILFAFLYWYRGTKYHKKQVERSLKMIPFLVTIPKETGQDKLTGQRDQRDVARELIGNAENMYNTLFSIYKAGWKNFIKNFFFRTRHVALEIVATKKEICFYMAVPYALTSLVEKAVTTHYPEAKVEEIEEHNIFSPEREMMGVVGGYVFGYKSHAYPMKTYTGIDNEPLEAVTNALSMLEEDEGAAVQILIRPANPRVMLRSKGIVQKIQKGPGKKSNITGELVGSIVNPGAQKDQKAPEPYRTTPMEEQVMKELDRKASKFGFETRIRIVVAGRDNNRADLVWDQLKSAFTQYSDLSINGFRFKKEKNKQKLVNDYIFRFFDDSMTNLERFWPSERGYRLLLNSEELASIYHFPNALIQTPGIKWLPAKAQQIPVNLPKEGIKFAKAAFRGSEEEVRISEYDKMRHVYVIGQTGTGKTVLMKNMMISDIEAGNGVCFIDPHGDGIEDIIPRIPKERAEDVIIFNAADTERPLGLNLFEARTIEQQDLVIAEAITMLYKLYDPGHQGIMGPRFEHWFRNAALALMADPKGGTFIEVPRIFTDDKFLAEKLKHVTDPVVRNFWINEMGQTADFHKSEVLGWFVGKFGAFMTNTTMRNILGQVDSSLSLRDIMDNKKILLVNLSKGLIGELNMQLLGMIFISKIQLAAMGRADLPEDQRQPFTLYIDEFQNFVTDNISQILSEARKYKLSLVMANQFIGQLRDDIKAAVFGNVGTMISFRVGAEDGEFIVKQFQPEFDIPNIINQENLHAICKMTINGLPSRPFTLIDYFPPKLTPEDIEKGKAIKELARLKHGRPREIVDAELLEKMNMSAPTTDPGGYPKESSA
jgi:hypothetical protein